MEPLGKFLGGFGWERTIRYPNTSRTKLLDSNFAKPDIFIVVHEVWLKMTTFANKTDVQQIIVLPIYSKPERPQLIPYCEVCALYFKKSLEQLGKDHRISKRWSISRQ